MKRAIKLLIPAFIIAAMFIVYRINPKPKAMYSDITGHWAYEDAVKWGKRGVMSGSEGNFRPDDGVTVAELATVFTRVMPLEETAANTFSDVEDDAWYTQAVLKCAAAGIIVSDDGKAFPNDYLSREDAFMMFARAFRIPSASGNSELSRYNDSRLLSDSSMPYIESMLSLGLISGGNEAQLYPLQGITRAQVANELTRLENSGYIHWED